MKEEQVKRLIACRYARKIEHLLSPRSTNAIRTAEDFALGNVAISELLDAGLDALECARDAGKYGDSCDADMAAHATTIPVADAALIAARSHARSLLSAWIPSPYEQIAYPDTMNATAWANCRRADAMTRLLPPVRDISATERLIARKIAYQVASALKNDELYNQQGTTLHDVLTMCAAHQVDLAETKIADDMHSMSADEWPTIAAAIDAAGTAAWETARSEQSDIIREFWPTPPSCIR